MKKKIRGNLKNEKEKTRQKDPTSQDGGKERGIPRRIILCIYYYYYLTAMFFFTYHFDAGFSLQRVTKKDNNKY